MYVDIHNRVLFKHTVVTGGYLTCYEGSTHHGYGHSYRRVCVSLGTFYRLFWRLTKSGSERVSFRATGWQQL